MSERTEFLQAKASNERARLSASFDALEREVDELTDWRTHIRRDPVKPLVLAAIGGAMLGAATTARGSRRNRPLGRLRASRRGGLPVNSATSALLKYAGAMALELIASRAFRSLRRTRTQTPE